MHHGSYGAVPKNIGGNSNKIFPKFVFFIRNSEKINKQGIYENLRDMRVFFRLTALAITFLKKITKQTNKAIEEISKNARNAAFRFTFSPNRRRFHFKGDALNDC